MAREGSEQRIVPAGVAAGMNEVKQRRDFSYTHFPGVAACGFCLDGRGGDAAGCAGPCMLPVSGSGVWEDARKKQIFTDNAAPVRMHGAALSLEIREAVLHRDGFSYFKG